MTPKAQRIAIAEACGWHQKPMAENGPLVWHDGQKFRSEYEIPDYLNDLNAMHEAEKATRIWTDSNRAVTYMITLRDVVAEGEITGNFTLSEAADCTGTTAAKRAEAFLRTLGLWKD